ncbi:unnamed protein product [Durusdinium trenchii]|uniref:Uncharacterized protein n=2 Tax=Durusdinium trenchii TaxID=1381693 RepID=A0ABP0JMI0_9DINO
MKFQALLWSVCSGCGLAATKQPREPIGPEALAMDEAQAPMCLLQRGAGQGGPHFFDEVPLRKELLAVRGAHPVRNEDPPFVAQQRGASFFDVPLRKELLAAQRAHKDSLIHGLFKERRSAPLESSQAVNVKNPFEAVLDQRLRALRNGASLLSEEQQSKLDDERLREEDDRLRHENQRLERLLAQLSVVSNHSTERRSEEMAAVLTSLLEQAPPPPASATNSSWMGDGSTEMDPKKRILTVSLIICGSVAFLVYVVYHAYVFFKNVREDPNGDHSVDWDDIKEFFAELICCGLSYSSAVNMSFVFVIAAGGFAFLWWQGIIQPFLKEIACYVYLGLVLFLLVGVILAEVWSQFYAIFSVQMDQLDKIMSFLRIDNAKDFAKDMLSEAKSMVTK